MEKITSRQNKIVSHFRALGRDRKYRQECRQYICDGEKLLSEALRWGGEIDCILYSKEPGVPIPGDVRCYAVPQDILNYVSTLKNSPGVIFSVRMRKENLPEAPRSAIVLEGIQDPGNLGTIIRTANALSLELVILTGGCTDLYNPKTVRAAMGAHFRQAVAEIPLEYLSRTLDAMELELYGAALSDKASYIGDVELKNAAVAVGSEGSGLSPELLSLCHGEVIIPMNPACESLNAAVAAAIIMWELRRAPEKKP